MALRSPSWYSACRVGGSGGGGSQGPGRMQLSAPGRGRRSVWVKDAQASGSTCITKLTCLGKAGSGCSRHLGPGPHMALLRSSVQAPPGSPGLQLGSWRNLGPRVPRFSQRVLTALRVEGLVTSHSRSSEEGLRVNRVLTEGDPTGPPPSLWLPPTSSGTAEAPPSRLRNQDGGFLPPWGQAGSARPPPLLFLPLWPPPAPPAVQPPCYHPAPHCPLPRATLLPGPGVSALKLDLDGFLAQSLCLPGPEQPLGQEAPCDAGRGPGEQGHRDTCPASCVC